HSIVPILHSFYRETSRHYPLSLHDALPIYAPGAAAASVVESIVRDQNKVHTASVYLEGEYGHKDINLGVPVVINRKGWERVLEMDLDNEEKESLKNSADAVRKMNQVLTDIKQL